jgi:hypothetical protein
MAPLLDGVGILLVGALLFAFPVFLIVFYAYQVVRRVRSGPLEGEITPTRTASVTPLPRMPDEGVPPERPMAA